MAWKPTIQRGPSLPSQKDSRRLWASPVTSVVFVRVPLISVLLPVPGAISLTVAVSLTLPLVSQGCGRAVPFAGVPVIAESDATATCQLLRICSSGRGGESLLQRRCGGLGRDAIVSGICWDISIPLWRRCLVACNSRRIRRGPESACRRCRRRCGIRTTTVENVAGLN